MTTTLKPHDFYVKLCRLADKYSKNPGEESEYISRVLEKWDKCRFAETNEASFEYLRNWAIDNASDVETMKEVVGLLDSHIEEEIRHLFPAHASNVRKMIGIPEPVSEEDAA